MNKNKIEARKQFYVWFEKNICNVSDYDDNNLSDNIIKKITEEQKKLCKQYGVDETVFDNVLYDLEHGGD